MRCPDCGSDRVTLDHLTDEDSLNQFHKLATRGEPGEKQEYRLSCWACGWQEDRYLEVGLLAEEEQAASGEQL